MLLRALVLGIFGYVQGCKVVNLRVKCNYTATQNTCNLQKKLLY